MKTQTKRAYDKAVAIAEQELNGIAIECRKIAASALKAQFGTLTISDKKLVNKIETPMQMHELLLDEQALQFVDSRMFRIIHRRYHQLIQICCGF